MADLYHPVSCSFYDHLEALATLKRVVKIHFVNDLEDQISVEGMIVDFEIADKAEYLVLHTGQKIRLDKLINVEGNPMVNEATFRPSG